jgi:hypothetical protein
MVLLVIVEKHPGGMEAITGGPGQSRVIGKAARLRKSNNVFAKYRIKRLRNGS